MTEHLEKLFIEIVSGMEQAKQQIELMRASKQEEHIDGRALSIAVTHLETVVGGERTAMTLKGPAGGARA